MDYFGVRRSIFMTYRMLVRAFSCTALAVLFFGSTCTAVMLKDVTKKDVANTHRCHFIVACKMVKDRQAGVCYCAYESDAGDMTCVDTAYIGLVPGVTATSTGVEQCAEMVKAITDEKEQDEFLFATAAEVDTMSLECPLHKKSAAVAHFPHTSTVTSTIVGCTALVSASFF